MFRFPIIKKFHKEYPILTIIPAYRLFVIPIIWYFLFFIPMFRYSTPLLHPRYNSCFPLTCRQPDDQRVECGIRRWWNSGQTFSSSFGGGFGYGHQTIRSFRSNAHYQTVQVGPLQVHQGTLFCKELDSFTLKNWKKKLEGLSSNTEISRYTQLSRWLSLGESRSSCGLFVIVKCQFLTPFPHQRVTHPWEGL